MQSQSPNAFLTGLILVCNTVLFWGILPIALVFALELQDGVTITWFRFLVAAIVVTGIQAWRGKLRQFLSLTGREWLMLLFAAIFLIADYVLFIYGLTYLEPSAMAVFSQTTPVFLALTGVVFFHERLNRFQTACFLTLFVGLGLFFNASIAELDFGQEGFLVGVLIAVSASFIWALYAALQKKLIGRLSSANILLFIYLAAVVSLLPMSDLTSFGALESADWMIITFCAFNTLIAYSTFSESMKYWPSTHISSVVATTPVATIIASYVGHLLWPDVIRFTNVNMLGWIGVLVVLTSAVAFNARPRRKTEVAALGQDCIE
ncbi:DMT family transporter [Kordiimonas lipolytica]|uniref:DMT family transporter n=1 Tax=Kordiimonas lipolytica TaxID=1662421 RepID=A0ABV8U9L1_9PROT|nr:DMT family transporter [Kordiimonas lipolytica]